MIDNFWAWIQQAVSYAVYLLNQMYNNSTLMPFYQLLLVVVAVGVIMRFIIMPIIGDMGSDKAKSSEELGTGKSDKSKKTKKETGTQKK